MIITTWIVYILARKGVGLPFLPITSSDIDVVESEAVSVLQHWLKKTEEEASRGIKEKLAINHPSQGVREKISTDSPSTHGQDIHVTRDVVKHHLSKSDLLANQSQEVLEERTRIQFIRWSHTRIFQVPSEITEDIMRDRIEQHIPSYRCLSSGLQYETLLLRLLRATGGSPSGSSSNLYQKNILLCLT
ncbi:spermatogenesis-associated protein 19, mitochondrial isoform X1 [Symphalangus syndactylus]|uniref:spermatogenesis-associated protein 19, mitochondrial isoform X1 n=1 Tax=Symphalangus syndactylus TaxID=9590 RepID=UPI0024430210|nr:spermatogenesis-associated protein 19, mitochondrial isoform X1 [Symphalangus syndactylus]